MRARLEAWRGVMPGCRRSAADAGSRVGSWYAFASVMLVRRDRILRMPKVGVALEARREVRFEEMSRDGSPVSCTRT